jgi:hypothetical protein
MALTSPGVEVKVIDESFYTPAEPGTVPLVIVATAQDKMNGAGDGTAPGTLKANAGQVYLITSQKDLVDTFGDPEFKTDSNNNPIHAGEQNEYGLQAAYSLLGVSNRAYIVRADVDLNQLNASATAPDAKPLNGTHWLDTQNTAWGIFEWNGAAATTTGGQTFTNKIPLVITDSTKVNPATGGPGAGAGGEVGTYAVVVTDLDSDTPALTTSHPNMIWYKARSGQWVEVGSNDWKTNLPTVAGSKAVIGSPLTITDTILVNGETISTTGTLASMVADINGTAALQLLNIFAAVVKNKLEIYSDGNNDIVIAAGVGTTLLGANGALGIVAGTYTAPALSISKHTQPPQWKGVVSGTIPAGNTPHPTGSVWIKSTENNLGARWRVKRWNGETLAWVAVDSPIYPTGHAAIYGLDKTGGGYNLPVGQLYVQSDYNSSGDSEAANPTAEFKIWRRGATTETVIKSAKITDTTFAAGAYTLDIAETSVNEPALSADVTASFTATGDAMDDALAFAGAINSAGLTNVLAEVDSQNRVVIKHLKGGEIHLTDGTRGPLGDSGFSAYDYEPSNATFGTGTRFLRDSAGNDDHNYVASNWEPVVYVASNDAPGSLTDDGTLWYNSIVDEVDLMIHNGDEWVGYKNYAGHADTDPEGPIVAASTPETQSDGTVLVTGDLWIDTSDIENYPVIYKFNADLANKPVKDRWILVDKTDQSTDEGVLFADARYNTAGANSDVPATIADLLVSDFVDTDAPDPALYPKGMLLWNLRRSGFNVKKFVQNYVDTAGDNIRFNSESQEAYYPHRWVTESANQADGSGTFGRKAQRVVAVQGLQALVNSNQQIRDEESKVFNLIACPGYPELIGEMITLNYDRGLTAFVIGDTPARLTSDATSLNAWGMNLRLALEDNDKGAASYDEYMAMFYPWGFTSDNFGNNVVVPPSHLIMRTIALSDQVSYPWFAPAGLRRGGITNATAVGYVDGEGEFKSVALNNGQRDTLYEAKINPITFFTGSGLVNYGQKTRAKAASALDRINVARLVIYLRRQLNALAKPYIFEPNDKITRDEIRASVESLMLELVGQRALYDYIVVCDESNNTPSRIDRNELWVDVAIEPVKAVEFIYIPLRIKNTGEIKGL